MHKLNSRISYQSRRGPAANARGRASRHRLTAPASVTGVLGEVGVHVPGRLRDRVEEEVVVERDQHLGDAAVARDAGAAVAWARAVPEGARRVGGELRDALLRPP